MRILLSAYACEPNAGSDKEVGWQWAVRLANLGYDVWVLVRSVHRKSIEEECDVNGKPNNLHFVYCELDWFIQNTNWFKGRIYLYYYLWQWSAYVCAKKLHSELDFDVVHHVTWVSLRQPSFMGRLGIPFIFGPCAGGDRAPPLLRSGYTFGQRVFDITRDVANFFIKYDPLMRSVFRSATRIYVATEESKLLIPKSFHNKVDISLAVGMDQVQMLARDTGSANDDDFFKVLYVGRFIGLKGMHLGMPAFARLRASVPNARLSMVGEGPDERSLRKLAIELDIDDAIDWVPWVEQKELNEIYRNHNCFLFPSLRDSGGLVVLEAMRMGLPVVCLNLGGPGVIVNDSCGFSINAVNASRENVINNLAEALIGLASNIEKKNSLSMGAEYRVKNFLWDTLVNDVYNDLN